MADLTFEKAKQLKRGDRLHHYSDGKCKIWRVNGKVKLWKRDPDRIEIPIKYGLYGYGYIHAGIVAHFQLESECELCHKEMSNR